MSDYQKCKVCKEQIQIKECESVLESDVIPFSMNTELDKNIETMANFEKCNRCYEGAEMANSDGTFLNIEVCISDLCLDMLVY